MLIRPEAVNDYDVIAAINRAAFPGEDEARLVDLIRCDGLTVASLVAVDGSDVVGHILFSPVSITTAGNEIKVASLAPMAVVPSHQRRGIGSMLVERGLQECKRAGYRAAIVVGHPTFYPRFGFSAALVAGLVNPFATGDAFMGVELVPDSLSGIGAGRVVYPDVFNQL